MKYIEQIKSFLLTFLVLLSIVFTLLIWNYKPDYEIIEETQIEEVLVGQTKEFQDVIKPYRLLNRQNDQFFGTVSSTILNNLYRHLSTWQMHELELINSKLSDEKMNEMLRMNNRATLFFNEEVPLRVFSNVLTFYEKDLPEASFTRLILDWSNVKSNNQLQLLFLNTEERIVFRAYTNLLDVDKFIAEVLETENHYSPYMEVERDSLRSLYVDANPITTASYTYLRDKVSPHLFEKIVFTELNIVQRYEESAQSERYTDGTSLMTVDTKNHILNYVYPPAESIAPILSSKLLVDSFDFVNDHGGFTADYRLSSMNIDKHNIEYNLFLHGYPVFSDTTSTRIVTTWGENRIFRYRRPYYLIGDNVERAQRMLSSGQEVIEHIQKNYPFKELDEVIVGYYLMQDEKQDLFILEPSWFAISNNSLTRISPESIRGEEDGLE